ncbi:MAG: hypothetical protein AAF628_02085 [Planctomycetota bacterium]
MIRRTIMIFALIASAAPAQECATAALGAGQPALNGMTPTCFGALPVPLPASGNPNFAISSVAVSPIDAGLPVLLMIAVAGRSIPLAAGVPLVASFGSPAILGGLPIAVLPAGFSGPRPGPPVPLPIPPRAGRFNLFVQTVVLAPGGTLAITDGIFVGT